MITFRIAGKQTTGQLEHQRFTVAGEATTEALLNEIARAHPVLNGGSPDADMELFQNVSKAWPFLSLVSNENKTVRHPGRIY